MRSPRYILAATLLALPFATMIGPSLAADAGHGHGHAGHAAMELNQGQKWATDAPLRQGMSAIHEAVSPALADARKGEMSAGWYDRLSDTVMTQFAYIVENCELEAQADAQLHILLANIAQGVEIVQGKAGDLEREAGLVKIAEALNSYGTHFEHPGWAAMDVAH